MVIRLVLTLALIAAVLWFAARAARKRGLGLGNGIIEVVARQRMGRASSVSVVRVAGRVLVVGATEEHVTLLAEVDGDAVEEALQERHASLVRPRPAALGVRPRPPVDDATVALPGRIPAGPPAGAVFDRAGWAAFVAQLRERTVRR